MKRIMKDKKQKLTVQTPMLLAWHVIAAMKQVTQKDFGDVGDIEVVRLCRRLVDATRECHAEVVSRFGEKASVVVTELDELEERAEPPEPVYGLKEACTKLAVEPDTLKHLAEGVEGVSKMKSGKGLRWTFSEYALTTIRNRMA